MTSSVEGAASRASNHPAVRAGARLGYAASGVLHLLLGWLALQVAWGSSSESADQTSALEQLSESAVGGPLLWLIVVGFVLLGVWQATEAVVSDDTKDRVKAIAKAVTFLVLAGVAVSVVTGSGGGDSEEQTTSITATIMENPLGRVAVAAVGLGIIAVGVFHVVKGWQRKFLEDLRGQPPHAVVVAGRVGYIAKGIALGMLGVLFVLAALQDDADQAGGMDAALTALLELPAGPVILTAVGLGIAAYGVYSFGRARYAKV